MNDEIDSNKVVAIDEKVRHFAKYAKLIVNGHASETANRAFEMWQMRTGGTVTEFLLAVQERLVMGSLKYGDTWKFVDLEKEVMAELFDIVCYEYLIDLKKKLGHWSQK